MNRKTKMVLSACLATLVLGACQPAVAETPEPQPEPQQQGAAEETGEQVASAGSAVIDAIAASYSTREFAEGGVEPQAVELILQAGAKAPSARNSQAWHFTVITDYDKVSQVVNGAAQGNVVILVSGQEDAGEGINVDFDCALATENMYLAAQSLGLGAHIYTGPVRSVNEEKEALGVPDGYRAVAILCIGQVENAVDAKAAATERNELGAIVTYLE